MYPPKLYSGPTIQSRSAARRAAQDLVKKIAILVTVVGHILLILAVQRELTKTQNNIVSYLDICGFSDFEEPENT